MITIIDREIRKPKYRAKILTELARVWGVQTTNMPQSKRAVESFSYSMKKNYPNPLEDWDQITVYEAAKILEGHLSRNTIESYRKNGWLRGDDGKVYRQEIQFLKEGLDAVQYMFDQGLMGKEKRDGRKFIVVYPSHSTGSKVQLKDQEVRAFFHLLDTQWFKDWKKFTDLSQ